MKIKEFNYRTTPNYDSVVVLGAGPSLKSNVKKVREYIKKNNSLVFVANYNFKDKLKIMSDYTYITDLDKFKSNVFSIKSDLILPYELLSIIKKATFNRVKMMWEDNCFRIYKVGAKSNKHVYECKKALSIGPNGGLNYWSFGIAGLGAMLVSVMCKPKKMLIVGLDDPKPNMDHKFMYDGKRVEYKKPEKVIKVINYFQRSLVPTIHNMGVKIETFKDVGLFGLSKSKLRIKTI